MENETRYRGPEIEEESKGSTVLGIIGAFLGAVVGAVPWFLASTFAHFFIGYLGFLVGWAAAFGYGKLHGRRSYRFAMVTVVICSILALVLADFASYMFVLCTDADWQETAYYYGVPVYVLAAILVTAPENLHLILPNLLIGLLIGILGVVSCRVYVRNYTQSGELGRRPVPTMDPNSEIAMANARENATRWAKPASTGLELPRQFAVRAPRFQLVCGIIFLAFAILLLLFALLLMTTGEDAVLILLILGLVLVVESLALVLRAINKRLEVDGSELCAYTTLGKATPFRVDDIAGVTMPSVMTGACKLYGKNGKVLFKYNNKDRNLPLLMQYLSEHNVPLMD